MTQLMAFPTTVSLCLKEKRNGSPDSRVPVAAQKITGTNVSIQKRDKGCLGLCIWGRQKSCLHSFKFADLFPRSDYAVVFTKAE